jgi:phosphohistidine phosphatase
VFITSPKIRAHETAELAAAPISARVVVDDRLGGSLDLPTLQRIVEDAGSPRRPVLVGHDPDFSELLAELIGVGEVQMKKGAYARIDIDAPYTAGGGVLRYLVPPDLLAGT